MYHLTRWFPTDKNLMKYHCQLIILKMTSIYDFSPLQKQLIQEIIIFNMFDGVLSVISIFSISMIRASYQNFDFEHYKKWSYKFVGDSILLQYLYLCWMSKFISPKEKNAWINFVLLFDYNRLILLLIYLSFLVNILEHGLTSVILVFYEFLSCRQRDRFHIFQ